jgi:voltage-gated potassium channel
VTTDVRPPGPTYAELRPKQRRRQLAATLVRPVIVGVALMALYFVLPLDRPLNAGTALILTVAFVVLVIVVVVELRHVVNSQYPRLRAIGAVAVSVPLFVVNFAAVYFLIAHAHPSSFTEHLDRVDALYYTVTVFSTVGFGDIAPRTEPARVVTMFQMLGDLVLLGVYGKLLLGAVTLGLERARSAPSSSQRESSGEP